MKAEPHRLIPRKLAANLRLSLAHFFWLCLIFHDIVIASSRTGYALADIRTGLRFYSDFSRQKTCPHCGCTAYHFVHAANSYQLMGLVYS